MKKPRLSQSTTVLDRQTPDPSHDIFRQGTQPLDVLFRPKNVAVIGATDAPGSVGRTLLWNLVSHPFGGTVFPVNPKRSSVLGIKSYPNIREVPEKIDLAVIVVPAAIVPDVVGECVEAGVKASIIISAGFKECGEGGAALEEQIFERARKGKMRIVGPNCLGVMNPVTGLNATFASQMATTGNVGFISQSGALCTAVLDWSLQEHVGFSAFISIGSMLDVGWGDLIDYLGNDPHTQSILIYMESIGDARSFLSAAREVALTKPIIVIKAGRTEAAARAAASHTGSLAGSDEVLEAAFRRSGVLRVHRISDLFHMAEVLAKQPRPKGRRLTIVTNAGGPGVLATDALLASGGELAELSEGSLQELNQILPAPWSHSNPIDILGDASPERYAKAVEIAVKDSANDGVLVVLTPQAMTDPTRTAEQLAPFAKSGNKPILASWMGGTEVQKAREILTSAGIPVFGYPDTAAGMFDYMWRYSENLRSLYETPSLSTFDSDLEAANRSKTDQIISKARKAGRTLLNEFESKQLLEAYGIPTVKTRVAVSESDAVKLADEIGYPVVLKLFSETVTHKTEVGGVRLNLGDGAPVRSAFQAIRSAVSEKAGLKAFGGVTVQPMVQSEGYELILGSSVDPQFGPVLLFGAGGQLVEVLKDQTLSLPPLNTTLARRMMERTRIFTALKGVRGRKPANLPKLEEVLVRFSQLVAGELRIKEIDINPFLVSPDEMTALDARVILHEAGLSAAELPKPAIRPYPNEYVTRWTLRDKTPVTIRPIRPEDEPLVVKFHKTLSEQTVRQRYFHLLKLDERIRHERLIRVCFNDYDREIALVADYEDPKSREHEILAVGRLSRIHGTHDAEFAVIVNDQFQRRGLGAELLRLLVEVGRKEKLRRITADILSDNLEMQRISEKLGFRLNRDPDEGIVKAELDLSQ